ncbi:enterochelin esterase domain-containing protein, partial [Escherichia coli]
DRAHDFKPLARLGDTDVWYRTERVPSDARFQYNFVLEPPAAYPRGTAAQVALRSKIRNDPLNSHSLPLLRQPIVELPDAPPQTWARAVDGVPQGT